MAKRVQEFLHTKTKGMPVVETVIEKKKPAPKPPKPEPKAEPQIPARYFFVKFSNFLPFLIRHYELELRIMKLSVMFEALERFWNMF